MSGFPRMRAIRIFSVTRGNLSVKENEINFSRDTSVSGIDSEKNKTAIVVVILQNRLTFRGEKSLSVYALERGMVHKMKIHVIFLLLRLYFL